MAPEYGIQSLTPSTVHHQVLLGALAMACLHPIVIAHLGHIYKALSAV